MTWRRALVVVGVFWGVGAHAEGVRHGNVTYRTVGHAYLNAGSLDGVLLHEAVNLESVDGTRTPCMVDQVSDHAARCAGKRLPSHARFELLHPETPVPVARVFEPKPLAVLQRERAQVVEVPMTPVEFVGRNAVPRFLRRRLWVSLEHDAFVMGNTFTLDRQYERLDVSLRSIPLGIASLTASLRATLLAWTVRRPITRFRPNTPVQLYVWQAEVDRRPMGENLMLSAGRILPWHIPGLPVIDGVQAGWRADDTETEVGGFAGLLPDMQTLGPFVGRWSVGAYGMMSRKVADDSVWSNNGRVAVVSVPQTGPRLEAEWMSWLNFGTVLHMGLNPRIGTTLASPKLMLDSIRGDVIARFSDAWSITATARWQSAELVLQDGFTTPAFLRSTTWVDGAVRYTPLPWIGGAITTAYDSSSGDISHYLLGPELSLPRLLGGMGGVSAAYLFETGTAEGQSLYFQANMQPTPELWAWLRFSYFVDPFMGGRNIRELAVLGRLDARLSDIFNLSASVLVRPGLANPTFDAATLASVTARLAVAARL